MLKNKRIAITRPKEQQAELKKLLELEGATVLSRPIIKIEEFEHKRRIKQVIDLIIKKNADIVVFTSVNGVKSVLNLAKKINMFEKLKDELNGINIAVIGKKTAESLNLEGIKVGLIPENYTSLELGKLLIEKGVKNKRIFLLRANIATDNLPNILLNAGATVISFTAYKVVPEEIEHIRNFVNEILARELDVIIFTSPFSVNVLFGHAERNKYQNLLDQALEKIQLVAIGPMTQNALESIGFKVDLVANPHTIEGIVDNLTAYYSNNLKKN